MGHDVVLLPPHLVRPYRRGSKNDRADTKALLEAYRNEEILSVPIKSVRQHTLAALHRCDDTHPTDGVPVGPARGQADSNTGPQRSLKVIGSSRADFPSWPGAPKTLLTEAVDMFAV